MEESKGVFQLNKTDISKIGFDLARNNKFYEDLASPFEEDQKKAHPLCTKIPDGFKGFQFQFQKVSSKLMDQSFIYIFYNIMDQKIQLFAARSLMQKGLKYHRIHKIWVRMKDQVFEYFDINKWKYQEFKEKILEEDYYTKEDFAER